MLQQDYLLRMFMQLATAMRDSWQRARGDKDPAVAAQMLEEAIEDATEMDGALLLRMTPESMAAMLQLSQPDPLLMGYISRTLLLSSEYLKEAGDPLSELRRGQAYAVARSFDVELSDDHITPEELESFFESTQAGL
ncbi:MAG: hypothetical protein U0M96_08315 [Eggerthellaceae bacterium]